MPIQLMESVLQEWRFSCRKILKSRGVSLTVILALGIAVGINTVIYTLADSFLLAGKNDKFFLVGAQPADPKLDYIYMFDNRLLEPIEKSLKSFRALVRIAPYEFALSNVERPLLLDGLRVGAGSPEALPFEVVRGRSFVASDFDPSAEKTAMITHHAWMNAYGGGDDAIGRLIGINGVSYRIIGLLPQDFTFHEERYDLVSASSFKEPAFLGLEGSDVWLVGRLKEGISAEQATAELAALQPGLSQIAPRKYFEDNRFRVRTAGGWSNSLARTQVDILLVAGSIMLLLASLTLCSFSLVQLNRRRAEYATRVVMGAKWWNLLRLFTIENAALVLAGGTLGVLLGYLLLRIVTSRFVGTDVGLLALLAGHIQFRWQVAGFSLLACLVVLALTGLTTFIFLSPQRLSKFLREDSYSVTGGKAFKWSCNTLLFIQVSATCVITIVGAFFLMSLGKVVNYDYGYTLPGIVQTDVHLPYYRFAAGENAPELRPMMNSILESIRDMPEVSQASASKLQFPHWGSLQPVRLGATPANLDPSRLPRARTGLVGPGFLELIGLQKATGSFFPEDDNHPGSEKVAVINEAFARGYLKGRSPLAEFIQTGDGRYRVIGVASDIRQWDHTNGIRGQGDAEPTIYFPTAEDRHPSWAYVYIRTDRWNAGLEDRIRKTIHNIDADVVVGEFGSLQDRLARSENTYRLIVFAQGTVAILGCILSCIAIYSALSYSVTQRKREMGIRVALGATPRGIRYGVLWSTVSLVTPAVILGVVVSLLFLAYLGLFKSQLYLVSVVDPRVYFASSIGLLLVGLLAGLHPALKAASADPIELLRST